MENENEKKIFNYLKNNWINKNPKLYNYFDIICNDNNEYNNKLLTHFYATNNVAESMHAKISKYLTKNKISNTDFVHCLKNILNINEVKLNKIIRKDFITRSLRKIAVDIKDYNFKWLTLEEFKKTEREIIAIDKDILEDITLEKNCSEINNLELDKEEEINVINSMINLEQKNENDEIEINDSLNLDEINNSINDINTNENNKYEDVILLEENSFEDANICNLLEDRNCLNSGLLDRLLNNKAFDQYKEIILKLKKNKTKKRMHISGESKDEEFIKNLIEKGEKENVK